MKNKSNDGDIIIEMNDDGTVSDQMGTTDDSSDGKNQSDNQVSSETTKWDNKSREDILTSYNALEKKLGEQGNQIGELRKQLKGNSDKGKVTSTSEMKKRLAELETKIYSDDFDRYDAEDKKLQREYDRLNRDFASMSAEDRVRTQLNQSGNVKVIEDFKAKYKEIPAEILDEVSDFAVERLSNDGKVSASDLEASLMRNDPTRYSKYTTMLARESERERISNAHTNIQPRMSATGQTNKTVNLTEMLANDPQKGREILRGLSDAQLAKLIPK